MDLVTGGTGIVGAHVIDALLGAGRSVRATCRPGSDREQVRRVLRHYHADGDARFQRITWVDADVLDVVALAHTMEGVERVFHTAALVSFDPRDTDQLFLHNITGTANVVNAMLAQGVNKLCHVSSTATIGLRNDGVASDESQAFVRERHTSPYAISKHEAELEVQRGIAEGLHAVMVNPCIVLGPGVHGRSSMTMIDRVRKGTSFFPPGSNAVVDARDVADAMLLLMDKGEPGERHLAIGENVSYRDLFTLIARSAGKDAPTRPLRPWMLELAWRVERLRSWIGGTPFITSYSARTAYRQRRYDGGKLAAMIGRPMRDARAMVENVARYLGPSSGGRA